jgi:periplasmic divalent cation tolerance protein
MIPKVASMYIWNDKIKKSEEMIMIFKTSIDKLDALQDWLEAHHPYDVPMYNILRLGMD